MSTNDEKFLEHSSVGLNEALEEAIYEVTEKGTQPPGCEVIQLSMAYKLWASILEMRYESIKFDYSEEELIRCRTLVAFHMGVAVGRVLEQKVGLQQILGI